MNTKKHLILFLALCLFSCSDEIKTNEEISNRINFLVEAPISTRTNVLTDDIFTTTFGENDVIGIFIYKRNEEEEPSIDDNELYVNNIKFTYKNGKWELERPIYYPDSKQLLDIYAYYPYKDDADVHSMEYNAHEEMKELLMTSVIGTKKNDGVIKLLFKHMQSLVHITLTKENNVPDFDNNLNIYFNGVIGGTYNIATQMLTEPLTGIIKMDLAGEAGKKTRSYLAYIPEQEVVPGILFSIFQMTSGKQIMSSKDIDSTETFVRGQVRMFVIRIRQEISKDIVYQQFDLYPAYGIPVGMVVEISNGGKNGKVISLKNIENVQWAIDSAVNIKTNATDINDGITNKMKIQSLENWEENFPAFKVCNDYGERWYLPSIGDMSWFMTNGGAWNGNFLNRINDNLRYHKEKNSALDIQLITVNQSYFSSTEANGDHTKGMKLYPQDGANIAEPKEWYFFVRPFYEF
jgi:hypothetical protein